MKLREGVDAAEARDRLADSLSDALGNPTAGEIEAMADGPVPPGSWLGALLRPRRVRGG